MTATLSRRQLLRGGLRGREVSIRPPFAIAEHRFTDTCERAGACIAACPEGVLRRGSGGFPRLDVSHGPCTFCLDCVRACRSGALDAAAAARPGARPWTAVARVGGACLSARGVTCRACAEACEPAAIRFRLAVGGRAHPEIDAAACTGCGACVAPCPVSAVELTSSDLAPVEESA